MTKRDIRGVGVLYIGGYGRSGSTLLDRMLGQIPGFHSVGELRYIWRNGLLENRLCGCGARFRECPFWSEVGRKAFNGWDTLSTDELWDLHHNMNGHQMLFYLLAGRLWPPWRARLEKHIEVIARLYGSIQEVSGSRIIVDSSKKPFYMHLLKRAKGLDVRLVHLARDSRGVAFSWQKKVVNPDVVQETKHMSVFSPVRVGIRWVTTNLVFHFSALRTRYLFLRYEDLVTEPSAQLARLVAHAGEEARRDFTFLGADGVSLGTNHTISGNPVRFQQGKLRLRADEEWRGKMAMRQRLSVLFLTWPLLLLYGYIIRGNSRNDRPPAHVMGREIQS